MSCCLRNEFRRLLVAALLIMGGPARAEPGDWFAPSPCDPKLPAVVALLGGHALVRVHDRPDEPAQDLVLHHGKDGNWYVPLDAWRSWTALPPPAVKQENGAAEVLLRPGTDLAFRLDACTAELWVDADPQRLHTVLLSGSARRLPLSRPGIGGFINLDAEYGGLDANDALSGLFDLGAFGPAGAGRSGFLASRAGFYRLDTSWVRDQPGEALRLRIGDAITHSAEWESAVRFGGVQWGRDFSLQPDRITFPLPAISGSAALPSTAQLFMNGQPLSQQALEPGQFRLESVPVLTGGGELSVMVRDALGREHTVTQPFYASPRLLEAGLSADTWEAGFLRRDYAGRNDRYTDPFGAALLQRGLNDHLTALVRAVAGDRRQQAGAEGDWLMGYLGVLTVSGAAAHTEAGWGGVGTLGFERISECFSISLRRRYASRAYGDLGRDPGTLQMSDAARLSWNSGAAGTASLVYIGEKPWDGMPTRFAGISYNVQPLPSVSAYLSWLHPVGGAGGGDSLVAGIVISFRNRTSGGVEWDRENGRSGPRAFVQHSPPGTLGWSWYGSADAREGGLRQARADWTSDRGTLGAGWVESAGHGGPSASAQTGFALLDGRAFWTRPVQNSFAVVDTGGVGGVRVYRENQLVGVTDSRGSLLVPDLLPYEPNHLGVDDRDLPITLGLRRSAETVVAPFDSGVPLRFAVDDAPSLRLVLRDEHGAPVRAGAALALDGKPLPLPVGYGGLVYLNAATGPHRLAASWPGGACEARLSVSGVQGRLRPCKAQP